MLCCAVLCEERVPWLASAACVPDLVQTSLFDTVSLQAGIEPDSEEELSVQEAYTPESTCWGCGELSHNTFQHRLPLPVDAVLPVTAAQALLPCASA